MTSVRQGGLWWKTWHDPTEKCWRQKKRTHRRKQRAGSGRAVWFRAGDVVYFQTKAGADRKDTLMFTVQL